MPRTATDTRIMILQTALQLFLQKGYKEVSYEDIINKTGLSKGAIYHYFGSKQDLLIKSFEFLLDSTKQQTDVASIQEIKDLASFKRIYLDIKSNQLENFKKVVKTKNFQVNKMLLFIEAINQHKRLNEMVKELLQQELDFLIQCFNQLKKYKQLPESKSAESLANGLYWMLQGCETMLYLEQSRSGDQAKNFIALYTRTIDQFFNII